ncbi:MAG TPA: GNAT family N-acetyltransferase [Terriglobia bacterium]|nr:GNAT family N-acetyltransferase [Terriglobia bacterium]
MHGVFTVFTPGIGQEQQIFRRPVVAGLFWMTKEDGVRESMKIRTMTTDDLPAGMRLKDLAGWNQTPADWRRFLESSPQGCFAAEVEGKVVGTAATIVYEQRFAWIGMVLVDPEFRGRGVGTRLLERTIEHLDAIGIATMKLDATPAGRPIYQKLGFRDEYEIERWLLKRPVAEAAAAPAHHAVSDAVLELDREIFGADRSLLLRSLAGENPDFALVTERNGVIEGYTFGRRGTLADHLGPWMARDEKTAAALLDEFLRRARRETIFVDALRDRRLLSEMLMAREFTVSRPLTRMVRGPNTFPGCPELLCAILGPEFG